MQFVYFLYNFRWQKEVLLVIDIEIVSAQFLQQIRDNFD